VGVDAPNNGETPVARFDTSARRYLVNEPIYFSSANSFDPEFSTAPVFGYNWRFNDGDTSIAANPTKSFAETGNPFVWLTVDDGLGGSSETFQQFFVLNGGVEPVSYITSDVYSGVAPLTVNVSGLNSYDPDGTIQSYFWVFKGGDPNSPTAAGPTATYTYTEPGVYNLGLDVVDNDGNRIGSGISVVVEAPTPPSYSLKAINKFRHLLNETSAGQQEKNQLSLMCARGFAKACYNLGKIYEAEGNQFAAQGYYDKACQLGYQEACQVFGAAWTERVQSGKAVAGRRK
jgi:hypothetical protein